MSSLACMLDLSQVSGKRGVRGLVVSVHNTRTVYVLKNELRRRTSISVNCAGIMRSRVEMVEESYG